MDNIEQTTEPSAYIEMMREFSTAARSCVALASAALVLPITILKAMNDSPASVPQWIWLSWVSLGLCVAMGILYQITAARNISVALRIYPPLPKLFDQTRIMFIVMFISLFVGILLLVVGLARAQ